MGWGVSFDVGCGFDQMPTKAEVRQREKEARELFSPPPSQSKGIAEWYFGDWLSRSPPKDTYRDFCKEWDKQQAAEAALKATPKKA